MPLAFKWSKSCTPKNYFSMKQRSYAETYQLRGKNCLTWELIHPIHSTWWASNTNKQLREKSRSTREATMSWLSAWCSRSCQRQQQRRIRRALFLPLLLHVSTYFYQQQAGSPTAFISLFFSLDFSLSKPLNFAVKGK